MRIEPAEMGLTEAAHELGVNYQVAWNLVLSRELEARKQGRSWLVSRASVERLREQRESPLQATA